MKVFQQRVLRWLETTFPAAPWTNLGERRRRFLEEALELLQALGMDRQEVSAIVDYVFNREPGEPAQELGGVMVTLGALTGVLGLDMEEEGEREITRVEHPSVRTKVQEKQKAKDAVGVGFERQKKPFTGWTGVWGADLPRSTQDPASGLLAKAADIVEKDGFQLRAAILRAFLPFMPMNVDRAIGAQMQEAEKAFRATVERLFVGDAP